MEVIGNEDGMDGSYFKGKVIDRSPGRRTIRYETLIADDGSHLEEVISIRRVRSPPPTVLARYHLGDMVDAWHNEGWWVGRYVRREGEIYTVFFENEAPENQHVSYPKAKICVHQEWKAFETGGKWKVFPFRTGSPGWPVASKLDTVSLSKIQSRALTVGSAYVRNVYVTHQVNNNCSLLYVQTRKVMNNKKKKLSPQQ
ncbi:hypothetical protein LXL04_033715 [Taraxacum kok-saghyz]